jgi:outer membrane scaffolding protein for murein synthesis (MipA/OmpV family)
LRDVSSSLNLSYKVAPKITVSGGLKASSLVGDARNSPVVTDPQSVSGGLSIGYAF